MLDSEIFWNTSLDELKNGFIEDKECYTCLLCGEKFQKGVIFPCDSILYEAKKFVQVHIARKHGSVFDYLTSLDKRLTGLTDHQAKLLKLFYLGKSDTDVQKEMGIGSSSTIRNHRFVLKEKERQAKVFLAMMELLKEKDKHAPKMSTPHVTAKMVDSRNNVTSSENEEILKKFFPKGTNGPLKTFAIKEKYKIVVLKEIAKRFISGKIYNEKEINQILAEIYDDFATLRRYLIEYGYLDRKVDGSKYWLKKDLQDKDVKKVDRKHELKQQYKEIKTEAGVYQIRNTQNNKVLVVSTPNLKTINGRLMMLKSGFHRNSRLQEDLTKYGDSVFVIEVLEVLEQKEEGYFDLKDELKKLEEKWLEKLQPFGEKGYN